MESKAAHRSLMAYSLLIIAFCLSTACSIPNLESPECSAARDVARQYYSLAIGGEPASRPEVFEKLRSLRAPNFNAIPATVPNDGRDPFYFSRLQPTAYRMGECTKLSEDRVTLKATVIWRLEGKNSERTDQVTLTNSNGSWLIDRIQVGQQPGPEF